MIQPVDLLVAGGGVAGVAAAVTAAREGIRTVLVEREGQLGGIGFYGMLRHICGLYLNGDSAPSGTLNKGMAEEFAEGLHNLSPEKIPEKIGRVYVLPFSGSDLAVLLRSLCSAEKNLELRLSAQVSSVRKTGDTITGLTVAAPDGVTEYQPECVIDSSGDGTVSVMAGADYEISEEQVRQMSAYMVHLRGLEGIDENLRIKVPLSLAAGVQGKALPPEARFSLLMPGAEPDEGFLKLSIAGGDDAQNRQRAQENALKIHRYLAEKLEAFRTSVIVETSGRVLEREGRRIIGSYMLTAEDVLLGRKFPDAIVKNSWPIELWDPKKGTIYKYLRPGDYYEIPFGCIEVKGISNLFTAGRCISVTHEALGSTRIMGACIALGEQAGRAAAIRIKAAKV